MIKGYARVSTDGQDLATQHELHEAAGATLLYAESASSLYAVARARGCGPGDEAGPLGALNAGLAQHPSDQRRSRGEL